MSDKYCDNCQSLEAKLTSCGESVKSLQGEVKELNDEIVILQTKPDLLPPGKYRIAVPGRPKCPRCGGSFIFAVDISDTGGSFCDSYDHKPECPVLRCPHGVLWVEDCRQCELEVRGEHA